MKELIVKLLKKALKEKRVELKKEEIEKLLEIPPSLEMGDYSFPCFFLAKELKQNPNQIALEIRDKIGNPPPEFEDIHTSGPYINFFINRKEFAENILKEILSKKEKFGSFNIGKKRNVLIEHTSMNPNASPHVGRARNAIIGDSLTRLFNFLNFKVETHFYVNDVSKQIAMLVLAKADNLKFENMLKKYAQISEKVKKSKKIEKEVFKLLAEFEEGKNKVKKSFGRITKTCIQGQKEILSELGIEYDYFDYESDYLNESKKILELLKKSEKLHRDKEGRYYLDQGNTCVENQMRAPLLILTRSNGTGLYPMRDIAYNLYKMKKAKENILVLGEDQKLYFQQIKEALKLLGSDAPKVIHYSFILLTKKGKTKKMSTRRGEIVLLEDFIKEAIAKSKKEVNKRKTKGDPKKIGVGAVKYAILKNNNNKVIHFNLDESLNFEGDTGPYIQYSYARASSILRKAEIKKKQFKIFELEQKELELVKKLSQFPELILNTYKNLNPSLIANYSYQLAQIFNEFYHACPVIGSEQEVFRLELIKAFRQTLKNSLHLLGIDTIERM